MIIIDNSLRGAILQPPLDVLSLITLRKIFTTENILRLLTAKKKFCKDVHQSHMTKYKNKHKQTRGVARKCVMLKPNTLFQLKLLVFHNFFSERPGEIPYLKKSRCSPGFQASAWIRPCRHITISKQLNYSLTKILK